jgi:hypothetical protein
VGKFYETKAFKKSQSEWYTKIKDGGFEDQERDGETGELIGQRNNHAYRHQPSRVSRESRLSYYQSLSERVETERLNGRDTLIMRGRSEGLRIKEILRILVINGFDIHRKTVMYIIRRYEHKWMIKFWSRQEMTSNRITRL